MLCFEVVATVIGKKNKTFSLVAPFIKHLSVLRQSQGLISLCFGCSVNWGQHWFEYFPNPPLNILSMVENVLAHHDKELLQHLVDCGITSQVTAVHSYAQLEEKGA